MDREKIMARFKETRALLSGHFELRSGLHSDQFFQCALLLQYPHIAEELCRAAVEKMRKEQGPDLEIDAVISPALGGIPVGHEVARALGVRGIFAEKKKEGGLELRRGFEVKAGERFVVAEDVITRGGRVRETVDIVQERDGIVVAIVVLVDRSGGKAVFDAPVHSLLQMTPTTWAPEECPLCGKKVPIDHPGS